ncbi:MAG: ABC transporter permease [Pseudomonadota bacterium]|nr:ABC transporter permease [Pseudomonadota bacterium]
MRLINRMPSRPVQFALGALPFVILICLYLYGSHARLAENPKDKILPSITQMAESIDRLAFVPSKRTGELLFWKDTVSSLKRLAWGVGIAALIGLFIGIVIGAIPLFNVTFSPFFTAIAMVPPIALLPILFIVFGLGEVAKIILIIVGITPFLIRDMQKRAMEIPREQLIKAQTLGANTAQIINRAILPQVLPRLIDSVRLALGTAWLFLISAEAIASTEGLGYRIFLVRRYLSMDVIIPYVLWITLLAFALDFALRLVNKRLFPWYGKE